MKTLLIPAVLAALAAPSARAQTLPAVPDDAATLASFERSWQTAAEAAAGVAVSIRVEREVQSAERTKGGRRRDPTQSGGVFDKRPDRVLSLCPTCSLEGDSGSGCPACKGEFKRFAVSLCSGTIIDADGLIATSHFNVNQAPSRILVTIPGRKDPLPATLLGYNAGADIALLSVQAKGLPVLKTTDLGTLRTGCRVIALGRAPDGAGLTVNPGIMSAPGRISGDAIQTDAHTNYGNVGGPMVDAKGRLVGITCKVDTRYAGSFGQNSGISFAVTYDKLARILPELRAGRSTLGTGKPFMGVSFSHEDQDGDGVKIADLVPGGGAEKAGVRPGDVVLEMDGIRVKTIVELTDLILKKAVNDPFEIKVLREGDEIILSGTLGEKAGE